MIQYSINNTFIFNMKTKLIQNIFKSGLSLQSQTRELFRACTNVHFKRRNQEATEPRIPSG